MAGGLVLEHILGNQVFDEVAHDRIQAVEGLVEENVLGPGGNRENGRRLPAHPLGKGVQGLPGIQPERRGQAAVPLPVEAGINRGVQPRHPVHTGARQEIELIGHIGHLVFHGRVVEHRRPVDADGSGIRLIHPSDQTQKGRFARAVGPDHPIDTALGDGTGDAAEGDEITEGFGEVFRLNHDSSHSSLVAAGKGLFQPDLLAPRYDRAPYGCGGPSR